MDHHSLLTCSLSYSMQSMLVILQVITTLVSSIPIDNGVEDTSVMCSDDSIMIQFKVRNAFSGRIFVKGMSDNDACLESYSADGTSTKEPNMQFEFGDCNMQRSRTLSPQKGMMQSIVVIISFHPIFITKVDKAFKVQCFYMEADKMLTNQLEVSMLTTLDLGQTGRMPTCSYTVRRGSQDGEAVKFARIGEPVFHEWTCDSDTHRIVVKNCYVDDGQGNKYNILDANGCAIDPVILGDVTYEPDGYAKAWVEAHVFKFADRPTVFFQCTIQLCNRGEDICEQTSPPQCDRTAYVLESINQVRLTPSPAIPQHTTPPSVQKKIANATQRGRNSAEQIQPVSFDQDEQLSENAIIEALSSLEQSLLQHSTPRDEPDIREKPSRPPWYPDVATRAVHPNSVQDPNRSALEDFALALSRDLDLDPQLFLESLDAPIQTIQDKFSQTDRQDQLIGKAVAIGTARVERIPNSQRTQHDSVQHILDGEDDIDDRAFVEKFQNLELAGDHGVRTTRDILKSLNTTVTKKQTTDIPTSTSSTGGSSTSQPTVSTKITVASEVTGERNESTTTEDSPRTISAEDISPVNRSGSPKLTQTSYFAYNITENEPSTNSTTSGTPTLTTLETTTIRLLNIPKFRTLYHRVKRFAAEMKNNSQTASNTGSTTTFDDDYLSSRGSTLYLHDGSTTRAHSVTLRERLRNFENKFQALTMQERNNIQEVDLFSNSISVMDLDALGDGSTSPSKADTLEELLRRQLSSGDFAGHAALEAGTLNSMGVCLSPLAFGVVLSLVILVLLIAIVVSVMLCYSKSRHHKIEP